MWELKGEGKFNEWSDLIRDEYVSNGISANNMIESWIGPDGNTINLSINNPDNPTNNGSIVLEPVGKDIDFRPILEAALLKARYDEISSIHLRPGNYHFLSTGANNSHILLAKLKNVSIYGNGARFLFHKNANGITILQCKRIRLVGLTLDFMLRTSSIGVINSSKELVVEGNTPLTIEDKVYQVTEIDPNVLKFNPGKSRIMIPPGNTQPVLLEGNRYTHSSFNNLPVGSRHIIIHHWYGGSAIKIDGDRDDFQTEDIKLELISIHSTPGIAIAATGIKRGLAILDSYLGPDGSGNNVLGPSWDGVHVTCSGGDTIINNCHFRLLGDDAININSPIHAIIGMIRSENKMTLSRSSRLIEIGDTLAFFNDGGEYIGNSKVNSVPVDKGAGYFEITVDKLPLEISSSSLIRTLELSGYRVCISNNLFEDLNVHAILAQTPHTLIVGNTVTGINRNAIRLLSNIGSWNEGTGAFNCKITDNYLEDIGLDIGGNIPWAAISIYGQKKDGNSADYLFNDWVEISDNKFITLRQKAIGVSNTNNIKISGNSLNSLPLIVGSL
jgi:hypothetical protein